MSATGISTNGGPLRIRREQDKAPPFVKVTKGGAFLREQIDKVMFIILILLENINSLLLLLGQYNHELLRPEKCPPYSFVQ